MHVNRPSINELPCATERKLQNVNLSFTMSTFPCLWLSWNLPTFAETLNQRIMTLSLKEGQMTISIEFVATDEKPITVEEVLIGAYDIISREFSQDQVIRAYYRTDPDTMSIRDNPELPDYVKKILDRCSSDD